jgi:hypothetical protein
MMFRQMVRAEIRLLHDLDQPQPLVEKAAQRRAIGVEMIEDGKIEHALLRDVGREWM